MTGNFVAGYTEPSVIALQYIAIGYTTLATAMYLPCHTATSISSGRQFDRLTIHYIADSVPIISCGFTTVPTLHIVVMYACTYVELIVHSTVFLRNAINPYVSTHYVWSKDNHIERSSTNDRIICRCANQHMLTLL